MATFFSLALAQWQRRRVSGLVEILYVTLGYGEPKGSAGRCFYVCKREDGDIMVKLALRWPTRTYTKCITESVLKEVQKTGRFPRKTIQQA